LIYIETLFVGESERYVKISAVEKGSSLRKGPIGGPGRGTALLGNLRER
jgi:hypothetical protein